MESQLLKTNSDKGVVRMNVKEALIKTKELYFAGYCNCGCGEAVYDISLGDGRIYQPLGEKLIKQVRPELLDRPSFYDEYGKVSVEVDYK